MAAPNPKLAKQTKFILGKYRVIVAGDIQLTIAQITSVLREQLNVDEKWMVMHYLSPNLVENKHDFSESYQELQNTLSFEGYAALVLQYKATILAA